MLGQVDGGISLGACHFQALPQHPGQGQACRSALSFSGEECPEALSHSSGCAADLGSPGRLLWLLSHGDHSVQEGLGLQGLASFLWAPVLGPPCSCPPPSTCLASVVLLENWVERQEHDGSTGLTGNEGARCWQSVRQCVAVLRWPGRLGCAGTLSLWTAVICADAEGLPWQPDLLPLLLPSQSQERVLITGAILLCLSAGQSL